MLLKKHPLVSQEDILGHKLPGENVMLPAEEGQKLGKYFALQLTHLSVLMMVSVIRISNLQKMRLAMLLLVNQDGMWVTGGTARKEMEQIVHSSNLEMCSVNKLLQIMSLALWRMSSVVN